MEEKKEGQRLTLEEMFDIFEQDVYKEWREEHGIEILHSEQGLRYIKKYPDGWWCDYSCPAIFRYLLAEQFIGDDLHLDLELPNDGTFTLEWDLTMILMWVHPLYWAPKEHYFNNIIEGKIAIQVYDPDRAQKAFDIAERHEVFRLLLFVDDPPILNKDDYAKGFMKGMHNWDTITGDYQALYEKALSGVWLEETDLKSLKLFNATRLRYSILFIAKERGGKRAAELVRLLQEEWPKIKVWKNALRNMSKEDIDDFENCLNHGFDDLLAEWESDETYFPLLTEKCLKEHKVLEVEKALQEAYTGSAVELWKKIKSLISEGYFEDKDAQYIYNAWEAYFGKMRYTDRNFRDARNKA